MGIAVVAFFAADTGVERGKFKVLRCNTLAQSPGLDADDNGSIDATANVDLCESLASTDPSAGSFLNDATYKLTISDNGTPNVNVDEQAFITVDYSVNPPIVGGSIKVTGSAGNSVRAVKFGPAP